MTILNATQRALIHEDTRIAPRIIDECAVAFDLLVDHDDREGYINHMATATVLQEDAPSPRPTDKMKTIIVKAYSDRWQCSWQQAHARLQLMLKPERRS